MSRSLLTPELRAGALAALVGLAASTSAGCGDKSPVGPEALAADAAVGTATPAASHTAPQPVPFRGTLSSTLESRDPDPPAGCQLHEDTNLEGTLTDLGRFVGEGTTCGFNAQFGVVDPPFNPGGGAPPYFTADFTVEHTYVAANGDLLEISGAGTLVRSMTDDRYGFVGSGVIEGGTGRFDGATGEFDVLGVNGVIGYDGWIVYDASSGRSD